MYYHKSFAARLRMAVLDDGRMTTAICREAGIAPHTLRDYLAGKYVPKTSTATKLANALDVSLDWLLGREANAGAERGNCHGL